MKSLRLRSLRSAPSRRSVEPCSGGESAPSFRTPSAEDPPPCLGSHSRPEAMPPLAFEVARLKSAFHRTISTLGSAHRRYGIGGQSKSEKSTSPLGAVSIQPAACVGTFCCRGRGCGGAKSGYVRHGSKRRRAGFGWVERRLDPCERRLCMRQAPPGPLPRGTARQKRTPAACTGTILRPGSGYTGRESEHAGLRWVRSGSRRGPPATRAGGMASSRERKWVFRFGQTRLRGEWPQRPGSGLHRQGSCSHGAAGYGDVGGCASGPAAPHEALLTDGAREWRFCPSRSRPRAPGRPKSGTP